MTTDYQGNSKKAKGEAAPVKPKNVEKVVVGEVVVQKKPLGRKIKDLFIEADFKSVFRYVTAEVMLPAARNMIVDASTKGIERMMYGDNARGRTPSRMYGGGPRVTYNSPIDRSRSPIGNRYAPPIGAQARPARSRSQDDIVLASRQEAELVLERMIDIIDNYEVASVGDLNELVGLPTSHIDNKWGWVYLSDAQVRQVREGYLLDLPPAEPIN